MTYMPALKALILDYDDTLVRTREIRYATLKRVARKHYHFEMTDSDIDHAWGKPGEEFMQILYGAHTADFHQLWETYHEECKSDPNEAHPGALEFVRDFASRFPVGILTSSSGRRVIPEMAQIGLTPSLFFSVQTADDTTVHKPNPVVFEPAVQILAQRGIERHEIVYVGDSRQDHTASTGAGLRFIGLSHNEESRQLFQDLGAQQAHNFSELRRMLEEGHVPPGLSPAL